MRLFPVFFLFLFSLSPLSAQSGYYIEGPRDIICNSGPQTYFLDSFVPLLETTWEVSPAGNAQILFSDLYQAEILFLSDGTYFLTATSIGENGNLFSDSILIYVNGFFATPEVSGCYEQMPGTACLQVCAHSQSTIFLPDSSLQWIISGAEQINYINPATVEITWGAGGMGMIYAQTQCPSSICFEILPQSIADFNTSPSSGSDTLTVCLHQEIYFENTSFNGLNYQWLFGDGEQSTSYDVSHSYDVAGYYIVTLQAESVCDCSDEKQIVVHVLPEPAPTLDCINTVCPEKRQKYTATTSGCSTYSWSISSNGTLVRGGKSSDDFIEVIWHDGPDGFIYLSVSGCQTAFCSFTNTFRVPILTPNGPVTGDQAVCTGEVVTYVAPYFPGTQYQWQVGPNGSILGGQNTNAIRVMWGDVNAVTASSVSVDYNNCFLDCSGSDQLAISITPEITLYGDIQVCQNEDATIHAEAGFVASLPAPVSWHIEDAMGQTVFTSVGLSADFTHTFSYPSGIYYWVATNASANYCTETVRQRIVITATPDAPLGIRGEEDICPGQTYGYTIEASGVYTTLWTITDGALISNYQGQTCQHTFGPTPPYIVEAVHANIQYQGCTSTSVSMILQTAADLAIEGPDAVCFNGIDSYTVPYIGGSDYMWEIIPSDHGELKRNNLNQVDVFWTKAGPVTLRLHTCGSILDKVINVLALPTFNLVGATSVCANETTLLSTDQPALAHAWLFEDGLTVGVQNNILLGPGLYGIEVTDALGCSNKKSFEIITLPAPIVHISSPFDDHFCTTVPAGINLEANTDGSGYQFIWFKDDVSTGMNGPVFNVTSFGTYHVVVTNQYGCSTVSEKVSFADCCAPMVCGGGGGFFPGCGYTSTAFNVVITSSECQTFQHTPPAGTLVSGETRWAVKSISKGLLKVEVADFFEYSYPYPGYYQVTVIGQLVGFPYVPPICGHFDKFTDTVRAVADFQHVGNCAGALIDFEDLTTFLPNETIASWNWDFDDPASGVNNISSLQDPSHTFSTAGDFEITLAVTMTSGCVTTKKINIHISAGPVLNPIADPIYCEHEALSFSIEDNVYDIVWDFDDVSSGSQNTGIRAAVFHVYNTPGLYTPTVSASDIAGCRTQVDVPVDIRANTLTGDLSIDPMSGICFGDTATLIAPSGGLSWLWSTDETTSQIQVSESNQYSVLIKDEFQCTYAPPAQFVEVIPKPDLLVQARELLAPGIFGPWMNSLQLCQGTEFEIQVFSTGNDTYQWGHGATDQILSFTYEGGNLPAPGFYTFNVTAIDPLVGCVSDTAFMQIEIFGLPAQPMISLVSGSGCSHDQNVLQVNNPAAGVTYYWSDGQQGINMTTTNSGDFFVVGVDQNGCSRKSNNLNLKSSAPVDQIPGGCFIACDPLTVCLPPLSMVTQYELFFNGVSYFTGSSWPTEFVVTDDGTYTIQVTTVNGCTATSAPLDILLYPGVGSITVFTYLDMDGDGMITAADMLLPGIPVEIISNGGLYQGMTNTNAGGYFVFEDYPSSVYTALINRNLLPSQWKVVIDSVSTSIVTCGDSVVVSLLLMQNCTVAGPDQLFDLCAGDMIALGDSVWTEPGTYEMHMPSAGGCDSVFQVIITAPDSLWINARVWIDVDHNGVVSPADTLFQGVNVWVENTVTMDQYILTPGSGSLYSGLFPDGIYDIAIDLLSIPSGYTELIWSDVIADSDCGSVDFDFLLVPDCSNVFIIQQEVLCAGDSILIEGQWLSNEGMYSFILNDPGSICDTLLDVFVSFSPPIVITGTANWDCEQQGTIVLEVEGEGPFQFAWSPGASGDSMVTGLQPGNYIVTVTDVNGCQAVDSFLIDESLLLYFEIEPHYEVEQGDSVLITISGNINEPGLIYLWTPSNILNCSTCPETYALPETSTSVDVVITDANSCTYSLTTFIQVYEDTASLGDIYVGNAFTPNGDGINDRMIMVSKDPGAMLIELSVLDRWGTLLYHMSNLPIIDFSGWDGTYKGRSLNPQVCVFFARVRMSDGKERQVRGDVILMK